MARSPTAPEGTVGRGGSASPLSSGVAGEIPSLAGITLRRAAITGKLYVGISVGISFVYALIVLSVPHGGPKIVLQIYPLQGTLYLALGSTGALMVFTSDRSKGVLEYLIAYGVSPSTLFWNGVLATAGLVSVVLAASLSAVLGLTWAL
ncbi:MAG: hypothetical protein L3K15_08125, partial [Thermoplasmata archaeon]|nr:hypothetical protein [Thermoplasmata archaeon]